LPEFFVLDVDLLKSRMGWYLNAKQAQALQSAIDGPPVLRLCHLEKDPQAESGRFVDFGHSSRQQLCDERFRFVKISVQVFTLGALKP